MESNVLETEAHSLRLAMSASNKPVLRLLGGSQFPGRRAYNSSSSSSSQSQNARGDQQPGNRAWAQSAAAQNPSQQTNPVSQNPNRPPLPNQNATNNRDSSSRSDSVAELNPDEPYPQSTSSSSSIIPEPIPIDPPLALIIRRMESGQLGRQVFVFAHQNRGSEEVLELARRLYAREQQLDLGEFDFVPRHLARRGRNDPVEEDQDFQDLGDDESASRPAGSESSSSIQETSESQQPLNQGRPPPPPPPRAAAAAQPIRGGSDGPVRRVVPRQAPVYGSAPRDNRRAPEGAAAAEARNFVRIRPPIAVPQIAEPAPGQEWHDEVQISGEQSSAMETEPTTEGTEDSKGVWRQGMHQPQNKKLPPRQRQQANQTRPVIDDAIIRKTQAQLDELVTKLIYEYGPTVSMSQRKRRAQAQARAVRQQTADGAAADARSGATVPPNNASSKVSAGQQAAKSPGTTYYGRDPADQAEGHVRAMEAETVAIVDQYIRIRRCDDKQGLWASADYVRLSDHIGYRELSCRWPRIFAAKPYQRLDNSLMRDYLWRPPIVDDERLCLRSESSVIGADDYAAITGGHPFSATSFLALAGRLYGYATTLQFAIETKPNPQLPPVTDIALSDIVFEANPHPGQTSIYDIDSYFIKFDLLRLNPKKASQEAQPPHTELRAITRLMAALYYPYGANTVGQLLDQLKQEAERQNQDADVARLLRSCHTLQNDAEYIRDINQDQFNALTQQVLQFQARTNQGQLLTGCCETVGRAIQLRYERAKMDLVSPLGTLFSEEGLVTVPVVTHYDLPPRPVRAAHEIRDRLSDSPPTLDYRSFIVLEVPDEDTKIRMAKAIAIPLRYSLIGKLLVEGIGKDADIGTILRSLLFKAMALRSFLHEAYSPDFRPNIVVVVTALDGLPPGQQLFSFVDNERLKKHFGAIEVVAIVVKGRVAETAYRVQQTARSVRMRLAPPNEQWAWQHFTGKSHFGDQKRAQCANTLPLSQQVALAPSYLHMRIALISSIFSGALFDRLSAIFGLATAAIRETMLSQPAHQLAEAQTRDPPASRPEAYVKNPVYYATVMAWVMLSVDPYAYEKPLDWAYLTLEKQGFFFFNQMTHLIMATFPFLRYRSPADCESDGGGLFSFRHILIRDYCLASNIMSSTKVAIGRPLSPLSMLCTTMLPPSVCQMVAEALLLSSFSIERLYTDYFNSWLNTLLAARTTADEDRPPAEGELGLREADSQETSESFLDDAKTFYQNYVQNQLLALPLRSPKRRDARRFELEELPAPGEIVPWKHRHYGDRSVAEHHDVTVANVTNLLCALQPIVTLAGIDLRGRIVRGADLSHADLSAANLSGGRFEGTSFMQTCLDAADLRSTCLKQSRLPFNCVETINPLKSFPLVAFCQAASSHKVAVVTAYPHTLRIFAWDHGEPLPIYPLDLQQDVFLVLYPQADLLVLLYRFQGYSVIRPGPVMKKFDYNYPPQATPIDAIFDCRRLELTISFLGGKIMCWQIHNDNSDPTEQFTRTVTYRWPTIAYSEGIQHYCVHSEEHQLEIWSRTEPDKVRATIKLWPNERPQQIRFTRDGKMVAIASLTHGLALFYIKQITTDAFRPTRNPVQQLFVPWLSDEPIVVLLLTSGELVVYDLVRFCFRHELRRRREGGLPLDGSRLCLATDIDPQGRYIFFEGVFMPLRSRGLESIGTGLMPMVFHLRNLSTAICPLSQNTAFIAYEDRGSGGTLASVNVSVRDELLPHVDVHERDGIKLICTTQNRKYTAVVSTMSAVGVYEIFANSSDWVTDWKWDRANTLKSLAIYPIGAEVAFVLITQEDIHILRQAHSSTLSLGTLKERRLIPASVFSSRAIIIATDGAGTQYCNLAVQNPTLRPLELDFQNAARITCLHVPPNSTDKILVTTTNGELSTLALCTLSKRGHGRDEIASCSGTAYYTGVPPHQTICALTSTDSGIPIFATDQGCIFVLESAEINAHARQIAWCDVSVPAHLRQVPEQSASPALCVVGQYLVYIGKSRRLLVIDLLYKSTEHTHYKGQWYRSIDCPVFSCYGTHLGDSDLRATHPTTHDQLVRRGALN